MIHLVFSEVDKKTIESAIETDPSLDGEVFCIANDYSVGPIENIYGKEGIETRNLWRADLKDSTIADEADNAIAQVVGYLRRNEEEVLWIWAAQNSRDVSGYFFSLHYLKEFSGRIFILYLNNLPFISEKGSIFYPDQLHQIPVREFIKAKKLSRPVTLSEFEVDTDEWQKLMAQNKGVRILEGGKKLSQFDYEYFDKEIKKFVLPQWQKASKIIQQFTSKYKNAPPENFVMWRLKTMVSLNQLESRGNEELIKEFEIKAPGQPENI